MTQTTIDLNFLAKQVQTLIYVSRQLRKEVADSRSLTVQTFDFTRRVERRQAELRDDLEVTIKLELGGAFAHFQNAVEASFARMETSMEQLSRRVGVVEAAR